MTSSLLSPSKSATAVKTGRGAAPVLTVCCAQEVSSPVVVLEELDEVQLHRMQSVRVREANRTLRLMQLSLLAGHKILGHLIYTRPVGYSCLEISTEP